MAEVQQLPSRRPFHRRRKTCPFSGTAAPKIDYKDARLLGRYMVRYIPGNPTILPINMGGSGGIKAAMYVAGVAPHCRVLAIKVMAVIILAIWMARSRTLIATIALGLIIGGAVGNAIDRLAYGAVVDFALFHLQIGEKTFNWYVFNFADVAIVAGVAALLYDSFLGVPAAKSP